MCFENAASEFTSGPDTPGEVKDELVQGGVVGSEPATWLGVLNEGEIDVASNSLRSAPTDEFWASDEETFWPSDTDDFWRSVWTDIDYSFQFTPKAEHVNKRLTMVVQAACDVPPVITYTLGDSSVEHAWLDQGLVISGSTVRIHIYSQGGYIRDQLQQVKLTIA